VIIQRGVFDCVKVRRKYRRISRKGEATVSAGGGNGADLQMGRLFFPFVESLILKGVGSPGIILGALDRKVAAGVLMVAVDIVGQKMVNTWREAICEVCRQAAAVAKSNGGDSIDGS